MAGKNVYDVQQCWEGGVDFLGFAKGHKGDSSQTQGCHVYFRVV
jgi:hypothetical protein